MKWMIRGAVDDHGRAQVKAELQPLLSLALASKRFLIVLDDVWRADTREDFL